MSCVVAVDQLQSCVRNAAQLSLKHELKTAGMERYSSDFPKKYETNHRQTMLEGWLRKILRTHSCFEPHVVRFLTPTPAE